MATQVREDVPRTSWLPRTHAPIVPRDRELSRVVDLVQRPDRSLLTLVGPPGAGKTTLALMAAHAIDHVFRDGVSFVDLSATRDPGLVAQTVAASIGIADASGEDLLETLVRVLRPRSRLLILDNFEQVLPAATMVRELLDRCPHLKMLVTSRTPLLLSFEQQCLVPPMSVPDLHRPLVGEEIEQSPAVALFKVRAQAVNPDWELSASDASLVAEICVRLDGLPLAIELAASWIGVLTASAILERLSRMLDLLASPQQDRVARHQTLRAAIRWSEDLLPEELQGLFRRLGVFSGGCTFEAAAVICPEVETTSQHLLQCIGQLVNHHLLIPQEPRGDQTRFHMLATIREYALERLEQSGELDQMQRRHASYYLALARSAEAAYQGEGQGSWLDRLENEYDNLRAALDWCAADVESRELGLELAASLWFFWTVRGHIREGRDRLENMLRGVGAHMRGTARAKALTAAGWLAWFNSDVSALVPLEEALSIYRELGDQAGIARALAVKGLCLAVYTDELGLARQVLDEAACLSQSTGDPWAMGYSAYGLGHLAARQGSSEEALQSFERSLEIRQAGGNRWGVAYSLYRLSLLALGRDELVRAAELQYQSLSISWELRNKRGMAVSAEVLACLAGIQGRAERAAKLFGVATALLDAANYVLPPTLAQLHERGEGAARRQLGPRMYGRAWNEGRSMPLAEGVAMALSDYGVAAGRRTPAARPVAFAGLSRREAEVVRLVALGLSDKQIAAELSISSRTVDGHLRRIYAKVGVSSRAALTAWAIQHGHARDELEHTSVAKPAVQGSLWQNAEQHNVVSGSSETLTSPSFPVQ
jgi:predicted ATPase/DNA-binding CsgD family transcriptional regulator